nr:unnamed protein product [Digitaria exilis]
MEALQWFLLARSNLLEETQLTNELDRLRATLPKARMLIFRSEWGMFKDRELAKLLSHLKDTTYDAEDLLRQLLSYSLNIAKSLFHRTKTRIQETQDKLDKVVAEIEGALNLMGLMRVEPDLDEIPGVDPPRPSPLAPAGRAASAGAAGLISP